MTRSDAKHDVQRAWQPERYVRVEERVPVALPVKALAFEIQRQQVRLTREGGRAVEGPERGLPGPGAPKGQQGLAVAQDGRAVVWHDGRQRRLQRNGASRLFG